MISCIAKKLCRPLQITSRLENVVHWYLLSLTLDAQRHDLAHAAQMCGLNSSQFSRLLSTHPGLAYSGLLSLGRYRSKRIRGVEKKLARLFEKSPWSLAIIIDSTLHKRSSQKPQNCQRFNHGGGFVFGHQWTNIVLFFNGYLIPLPPLEFLTKKECRNRNVCYLTEHDRLVQYLPKLDLAAHVGYIASSDVVVLSDSGYDSKKIQNCIVSLGWSFVSCIKSNRSCRVEMQGEDTNWLPIKKLFNRFKRRAPNRTVRFKKRTDQNKVRKKSFSAKRLEGNMNGLHRTITLVCSKIKGSTESKYLACTRLGLPTWVILRTYDMRFLIENLHKDTKQYLGLMDAGLKSYDAVKAHVHWVYCAYLLLQDLDLGIPNSVRERQKRMRQLYDAEQWKEVIQLSTRADGRNQVHEMSRKKVALLKAA